jgi:uncharacterized cupredoxin-like copper-binding protein
MKRTKVAALAAIAGAAIALAGCGGSSTSSTTTAPPATTTDTETHSTSTVAATGTPVAVTFGTPTEFSTTVDTPSVAAGDVTFTVTNNGKMPHEFVVVAAPDGAAALKESNGEANEDDAVGEIEEVPVGKSGTLTLNLKAGKYVLLCNLPGHFAGGMFVEFTVA